jgi:hypothetical protein
VTVESRDAFVGLLLFGENWDRSTFGRRNKTPAPCEDGADPMWW